MQNEPAITGGIIGTIVTAIIALVVAFGVHLTPDQTAAIIGVPAALGPLLTALGVRGYVTPTANVTSTVTQPTVVNVPVAKSSAMP